MLRKASSGRDLPVDVENVDPVGFELCQAVA
jgi:hypothetical protein